VFVNTEIDTQKTVSENGVIPLIHGWLLLQVPCNKGKMVRLSDTRTCEKDQQDKMVRGVKGLRQTTQLQKQLKNSSTIFHLLSELTHHEQRQKSGG
jgi:hypothetical protein